MLFGTIIAQVNEIVAQISNKKKDLDDVLEKYLSVKPRSGHNMLSILVVKNIPCNQCNINLSLISSNRSDLGLMQELCSIFAIGSSSSSGLAGNINRCGTCYSAKVAEK